MIPTADQAVYNHALALLAEFGAKTGVRGRFVALYLGLRRLGAGVPVLGSGNDAPANVIENFLDDLYSKAHPDPPYVVLTALFGGSTSPHAPYSTRTGVRDPERRYPTNTWRNNFNVQKGIGCPAEPAVITELLETPGIRLACPHMTVDENNRNVCGLDGSMYRGEEHSIWLRHTGTGYQVVDLDNPAAYGPYLSPKGQRIPMFPLLAALYSFSLEGVYPPRPSVTIPDFADDFHFTHEQVATLFDCDVETPANAALISRVNDVHIEPALPAPPPEGVEPAGVIAAIELPAPGQVPLEVRIARSNVGTGAEILVAKDLASHGWTVGYRGNQRAAGFDLEAIRAEATLRVEVKSSVGFCTPELTASEWAAAQTHSDSFVLAVVDFFGSERQAITYIRDPAALLNPVEVPSLSYRLPRSELVALGTEAEFL